VLEIFREVRKESVVDLKMLIVGGLQDEKYSNRVLKKISATEEAEYLGYVEREKLDQLLATCKYGIHGKRLEHFGIAPAEMALSGILPFVPDAGGQVEIVNNISHLTYNGLNDATRKLVTVINNPDLQRKLLGKLSDSEDRFCIDRYRREIKDFVFQTLN
jgi:hypothetical protein